MAGFLDEFVKLTVNETIGTDYPHIRHPALYQAKVMEGTVKDGASYVTLRLLKENGETDEAFPAIPYIRTEQVLKKGDVVAVGLYMGSAGRTSWGDAYDTDGNGPDVRRYRAAGPPGIGRGSTGGRPGLFPAGHPPGGPDHGGGMFFDSDYGWSLLDFCHREIGELEELQIKNRVTEKLRKRDEINPHSIGVGVSRMGDDIVNIHVGFKIANEDVSYQMDLELDGAEVKLVD